MSNLHKHALMEFKAAGWINDNGEYCDEMQGMICDHVLKLLDVFSDEGHSGSSAPYAVNLFKTLAMFEPIVPLTGEDWEWTLLDYGVDPKWQNKRCGRVFKDADGRAYDIDGIVFYEWFEDENHERHKSHFTGKESRVYVTFPYTPTTEYKEWVEK
jgi:hypothetical protein